jgi:hypothetical protein
VGVGGSLAKTSAPARQNPLGFGTGSTILTLDAEEVVSLDGSIGMTTLLKAIMRALLTATRPE